MTVDPCPICGKERATRIGDFQPGYFCQRDHAYQPIQPPYVPASVPASMNEVTLARIAGALERIAKALEAK